MILADEADVGRRWGELKQLGVRISCRLRHRYSSIGHLERFPVDELKIDRSFVASVGRNGQDSGVALGDAIRIAEQTRLDAVILDAGLPDMTGFEIAKGIVDISQGGVPIIYLSGTAIGVDDRIRGLNLAPRPT